MLPETPGEPSEMGKLCGWIDGMGQTKERLPVAGTSGAEPAGEVTPLHGLPGASYL